MPHCLCPARMRGWSIGRVDNDGYASYEKVLAIAACNDRGRRQPDSTIEAAKATAVGLPIAGGEERGVIFGDLRRIRSGNRDQLLRQACLLSFKAGSGANINKGVRRNVDCLRVREELGHGFDHPV